MASHKYKIREICGDWALDIHWGMETITLFFNSRNNADLVKAILEWEDAHPNEAVPYKPTLTPPNEPLTLDELREMDGQPVWVLDKENPQDSGWTIWAEEFNDLLSEGSYGTTWIAYAYHPAHIDMAAWGCPLCNRSRVISFKAWEDEETYQEGGPFVQGGALFCPRCGKPRTPEAQAELEKRLRG